VNRADGISEIEGKAAKGSGERVGKRASFKSGVPQFVFIRVDSWLDLKFFQKPCNGRQEKHEYKNERINSHETIN